MTEATQVTVRVVPANQAVADQITELRYRIGAGDEWTRRPMVYPFDIAVAPRNEGDRFNVTVDALLSNNEVIRGRAMGAFVTDQHLQVILTLDGLCGDVLCAGAETCREGLCQSADMTGAPFEDESVDTIFVNPPDDARTDAGPDATDAADGDITDATSSDADVTDAFDASDADATPDTDAMPDANEDSGPTCTRCVVPEVPCRLACEDDAGECVLMDEPVVGACGPSNAGRCDGTVCVFRDGSPLIATHPEEEPEWGARVFLADSLALVGQPAAWRVHGFRAGEDASGGWDERWNVGGVVENFGYSFAVGSGIAIGGNGYGDQSHLIRIFVDTADFEGRRVMASSTNVGFGSALGYAGDRLIVGIPGAPSTYVGAGIISVLGRTWVNYSVPAPNRRPNLNFGRSVTTSEEFVAIGARGLVNIRHPETFVSQSVILDASREDFGVRLATISPHRFAVSDTDGVTIFELPSEEVGRINNSHTCLAATDDRVYVGSGSLGVVRAFAEVRGEWTEIARYEHTGATDLGESCHADTGRLIAGAPEAGFAVVFGNTL